MHDRLTALDSAEVCLIALAVVPDKRLAVLEHRAGCLLGVIKGIVTLAQTVLDDVGVLPQRRQRLPVLLFRQIKCRRDLPAVCTGLRRGGIDRRQPLCQQRNRLAALHSGAVRIQLCADDRQCVRLACRAQQRTQIVVTAVFCNHPDIPADSLRLVLCKRLHCDPEEPALAEAAAGITDIKQDLHRPGRILCVGTDHGSGDVIFRRGAHPASTEEQIQTVRSGGCMCQRTVFGAGQISFPL